MPVILCHVSYISLPYMPLIVSPSKITSFQPIALLDALVTAHIAILDIVDIVLNRFHGSNKLVAFS